MKCKDIIEIIDQRFPEADACSWDNVGLQVGRFDKEVQRIYLALDATDEVIEEAIQLEADLLITHHPMIFSGIKKINQQDFIGKRVLSLARNDISYYAMHTNYDIHGMADLSLKKMGMNGGKPLEVTGEMKDQEIGIGKITKLPSELSLKEFADKVKTSFGLECVRVYGNLDSIVQNFAICPGSGKSEIKTAISKGADVFVTGDLGHHDCLDAVEQGLSIIDAGHYGLEHIFIEDMYHFLQKELSGLEIICAPVRHPFYNI